MPITFTKPATVSAQALDLGVVPHSTADVARIQAGQLLLDLFRYLEDHAVEHTELLPAILGLREAVAEYRLASTAEALEGVRKVVALINQARAANPELPEP